MEAVKANIKKTKYETVIASGDNQLIADESIANGGMSKGFNPSELLASSLAACTSITLRMYADRKEWDLKEAQVEVSFETIEGVAHFKRNILLSGTLDEEQKLRLTDIANKCPIHKVLSHSIQIHTTLS